jgi:hypothetical protein
MKRLHWYDYITINLFWLGLNIRNTAVGSVFTPYLVALFVPTGRQNTALGAISTAGLIIAMLVQPAAFAPQAFLQCFRVEPAFAHLRDREGNAAHSGMDRLRLVAISMPLTFLGMLIRFCLQVLLSFRLHRRIDDHLDQLWQNVKSLFADPFQKFSG